MSKYQIEQSSMWADVRDIFGSGKKGIKHELRGMLHTEKEDVPVLKIMVTDLVRDYHNNIADHLVLQFKMPLGEYISRLYPFRTNLEFSIKTIVLEETGGSQASQSKIQLQRYKAVFLINENPHLAGSDYEQQDTETMNKSAIIDVKLELHHRSLEPLRIKTVSGGSYRKATAKQLIHNLLAGESQKILVDGNPAIDGIDIIDPDNTEPRDHTVFPSGTLITTIPTFLQERMGGVYNSGIGTFLQVYGGKTLWFVYPLYNTTRFDTCKDGKLIIYSLPEDKFPSLDRTYNLDGNILSILATGAKKYKDTADIDYMNKGSGFRMMDASSLMKKPVVATEDGPKAVRTRLNYEVAAETRADGLNYAPMRNTGSSTNPFMQYSLINSRRLAQVDITWDNCDPSLVYPGMPVKYVFLDNGEVVELKGTVIFIHALTVLQGNGINGNVYRTKMAITILVEEKKSSRAIQKKTVEGTF
jgi:hypothetical protein